MTSFAAEKSAASARIITALTEVPSTLAGTPSTLAKVPSTDAEVISFWRKVDRELRKVGRGCGEVGGGGARWMAALLATGIYGARMVGVGRSLAALSVVDGGGRGRNRCFLA